MIENLESILGVIFKDKEILERALTHSSYSKDNYERFEFLGDSVLGYVVSLAFFEKTAFDECYLSRARANLVSSQNLAVHFDKMEIEKFVRVGKSMVLPISASIKSDIMEAIIGAIHIDQGLAASQKFIMKHLEVSKYFGSAPTDSKTKLQEFLQKKGKVKILYIDTIKSANVHDFTVLVSVYDTNLGKGTAKTKREAQQIAASRALMRVKQFTKRADSKNLTLQEFLKNKIDKKNDLIDN